MTHVFVFNSEKYVLSSFFATDFFKIIYVIFPTAGFIDCPKASSVQDTYTHKRTQSHTHIKDDSFLFVYIPGCVLSSRSIISTIIEMKYNLIHIRLHRTL